MVLPRSRSAPVRLRYSFSQVSADHPPRGNLRLAAGGLHLVNGAHNNTITSDTFTGTASTSRLLPVVSKLLARAQADGSVRADLQPTDIPLIEFMLAMLAEYVHPVRPGVWRRYLAIILDGLRPGRATVSPLPEPPLSPAEIWTAMRAMPAGARPARPHELR
jgi:hypothetical protein